jgi:4-hydroxy-2-oxoheptanedioate aldolase
MPSTRSADASVVPLHGIWRIIPSPACTEILAQSGLDFQIFDCEHGAYDYQTLLADIIACEANHCVPWVRVSGTDKVEVQRCLDLGARAVVFPQLATYADFAAAAAMMDHAPAGTRGFNPFVRAYGYGTPVTAVRPWFVPIIETLAAVEQLESIVKLDRIDLFYIGSYDLSAQLGVAGKMDAPELTRVVDRIIHTCRAAGKEVAAMALAEPTVRDLVARGVRTLVHGVESHRFKQAMAGIVQASRGPASNLPPSR